MRPVSEGLAYPAAAGLVLAIGFLLFTTPDAWPPLLRAFAALLIFALPQVAYELRPLWPAIRSSLNLTVDAAVRARLAALTVALLVVWALMLVAGNLGFKQFEATSGLLFRALPFLLLAAIPYFCLVTRMQGKEPDEYAHVGALLLGRRERRDWKAIAEFAKGWVIKGFFFPLMFTELLSSIAYLDKGFAAGASEAGTTAYWFALFMAACYFIDVCIASAGYLATLRIFGWNIRSTNPYPGAWIFTLVCYYPFFGPLYRALLDYRDGYIWSDWLATQPLLFALWAAAIVVLKVVWIWSMISFGLRFSNLTNRGILTDGAFRLMKHPGYVSKNLSWWMVFIPFVSPAGWTVALINCAQLFAVNAIYFMRARYEERHLSEEPRYVEYALWMEEHGIFRWVGRLLPFIRYRPSAGVNGTAPRAPRAEGLMPHPIGTAETLPSGR